MIISRFLWLFYLMIFLVSCEKKEKETFTDAGFIKSGQYLGDYYPTDSWRECAPSEVGMDPDNAFYQWRNSDDHIGFILDRPIEYTPGTMNDYNSGLSDLLSVIVQKETGVRLDSFALEHILKPIGIQDYYWEIDKDGHAIGYGQMRLSSRNMARFGYLYLKKGIWEDQQLISQH
jgi:CubicO group peptidase (beta-lactamase class C family)